MDLRTPTEMGGPGGATNPEQLFASGYSACFNGALNLVALTGRIRTGEVAVSVTITLGKDDQGNFELGARVHANVPGVSVEVAKELVEKAHTVCPYSRAIRGNVKVELSWSNQDAIL